MVYYNATTGKRLVQLKLAWMVELAWVVEILSLVKFLTSWSTQALLLSLWVLCSDLTVISEMPSLGSAISTAQQEGLLAALCRLMKMTCCIV